MSHNSTPNVLEADFIQKLTRTSCVSSMTSSKFIMSMYSRVLNTYSWAGGHGLCIAMQTLIFWDSWITPWPDFSEWADHLHLYAFLPFLNIVGPLTRGYFKQLIFTRLIRRSLFWPLACVRSACVHSESVGLLVHASHHSYKKLANIDTGIAGWECWLRVSG